MFELILSLLFLMTILLDISWLVLYFMPSKGRAALKDYPSLSIILPAHNEADVIEASILHGIGSTYPGVKEVIVVNDGSTDRTREVVERVMSSDSRVRLINVEHSGKAKAINTAFSNASGEIVVVVDADSKLEPDALMKLVAPFSDERVGAVSGVIRVSMNGNPLTWFQDVEYMMSSTWRHLVNKLNATYLLPGFTAFRRKALEEIGGFCRDTLCEDFEIGLRMKKAGYRMVMADAVMYTHPPQDLRSLIRQRLRWSRGTLQVFRKHSDVAFNRKYGAVGLYGLPTQMYWFFSGAISLPITLYQITNGYLSYFVKYNDLFSFNVFKYFFGWMSVYGMMEYAFNSFTGVYPMDAIFILCFLSFIIGMAYTILSLAKFPGVNWRHFLAIAFYFPYSLLCLTFFLLPLFYELYPWRKKDSAVNIWNK